MISNFVGGMIFGSIGFVAFVYGKKMAEYKCMFIGLALMIFPYFVSGNWPLYLIGTALTLVLFFWKD
ncbi:MAG: hypothetical protein JNN05_06410 [Candidatus Omnitrophica bacterium]|nr:hypothetical protein [Candidatus Omnitrophota bacterium]